MPEGPPSSPFRARGVKPSEGSLARLVGLPAISFSRDSDGKEERLREWAESKGLTHYDKEHRRNGWTAAKYGLEIADDKVSSNECAADVGTRGEEIIAAAEAVGATVVIIPSLRRLGVGEAQVIIRKQLERAGLTIISERETETAILTSEPSPTRETLLWDLAGKALTDWLENKERLARSHRDYWDTPEGQATLDFIAERPPPFPLRKLGAALDFYGHRTPGGLLGAWERNPMSVSRARARAAARIETAPIHDRPEIGVSG